MASRSMSPGGALLRSSRMFSMPAPIAGSTGDFTSVTRRHSPTATTPFPTHLTITTPQTSRTRGDWGLKRPLPLKTTTHQTYPLVRVQQMDSIEHITDFRSASDHTMTLKKFQELNLPISMPASNSKDTYSLKVAPHSVFEKTFDVTAIEPAQALAIEDQRWNFKGPWLAGMTDGAFNNWLHKNVRPRRAEFLDLLKKLCASSITEEAKEKAISEGKDLPAEDQVEVTKEQFMDYLRDIRKDRLFLLRLVSRFLDLAPVLKETSFIDTMKPNRSVEFKRENPYSEQGPPITHPSAGLSYLRTANFLDNHPIYGPQKYHPMVKARVLKPRNITTNDQQPVVAVAGFVVDRPFDPRQFLRNHQMMTPRNKALAQLDLENPGGAKLYYKVDFATVNSSGKVCISVSDTNNEAELVTKELVGENSPGENVYEKAMDGDSLSEEPLMELARGPGSPNRRGPRISWSNNAARNSTVMYSSKESYGL